MLKKLHFMFFAVLFDSKQTEEKSRNNMFCYVGSFVKSATPENMYIHIKCHTVKPKDLIRQGVLFRVNTSTCM